MTEKNIIIIYLIVQGIALLITAFISWSLVSSLFRGLLSFIGKSETTGEIYGWLTGSSSGYSSDYSNMVGNEMLNPLADKNMGNFVLVRFKDSEGQVIEARSKNLVYRHANEMDTIRVYYKNSDPYYFTTNPMSGFLEDWDFYKTAFYISGGLALLMLLIQLFTRNDVQLFYS